MRLLSIETLEAHKPRLSCGDLHGCTACGWNAPGGDRDNWVAFLYHIPVAVSDGQLALTREDMDALREMHIEPGPMEDLG